jgi:hypothetical protein
LKLLPISVPPAESFPPPTTPKSGPMWWSRHVQIKNDYFLGIVRNIPFTLSRFERHRVVKTSQEEASTAREAEPGKGFAISEFLREIMCQAACTSNTHFASGCATGRAIHYMFDVALSAGSGGRSLGLRTVLSS